MKRNRLLLFPMLFVAGISLCTGTIFADFDDLGAGARAIGMGNSFTAVADDAFGIYYNPAGLGFIRTAQVGADFGKMYFGLNDGSNLVSGFGAVAFPLMKAKLYDVPVSSVAKMGAAMNLLPAVTGVSTGTVAGAETSSGTVKVTYYQHLGTLAFGMRYFSLVNTYQESAYYMSYGRPVGNKWAWGVNLKLLQEKYIIDDYLKLSPVFQYGNKDSVSALSADIGAIYNIAPRFFLGASVSDINQPNLGLLEEDKLPYTARLGMAWKEKGLCWALDSEYRQNEWYYSTGFERYVANVLGLRAGIGMGGHNYFNIAAGFTLNFYRAQLDYVFQYPLSGIQGTSGTHRMSFTFRFGRRGKEEMEIGSIEYYYSQLQDEVENVKQRLAQTKNEKDNLESILLEEATLRIRERIKAAKAEAAAHVTASAPAAPVKTVESREREREPKEIRYVVRQGDTLQSIAERYYGATKFWDEIYQANKDSVGRGGVLKPTQVLIIPAVSKQDPSVELPLQARSAQKAESAIEAPKIKTETPKPETPTASGEKIIPIKVLNTPGGVTPVVLPGLAAEKITPVTGEFERTVQKKKDMPRPVLAKAKSAISRRHLVQPGENLRSIAQKYYNDSNRWKEIYQANRDKVISGQVAPGQEIVIP